MNKIRLTIDVTPMLLRSAGVKTYVFHWARAMMRLGQGRVDLFPFLSDLEDCNHESSIAGHLPTLARIALLQAANYGGAWVLRPLAWRTDVFHASGQLRNPPRNACLTTTLHDMTCWVVPELHSAANVRAAKLFAEKVICRADGLIAVSQTTKEDAVRILGLDPGRIEVIYHGVAEKFFSVSDVERRDATQRYGLKKPYVLFVGTIEPRKNISALLDAWRLLGRDLRDEFDLVAIGPVGWEKPCVVGRLREGEPGVRYLGYVSEADLPALTGAARIFVYPSLYEGFGFPVAQAMAAGVPVVTSNISSLPEVTGDAALLADPRSPGEISRALDTLMLSPDACSELGARGRARAQRYRWKKNAETSWRFFERLL